MTYPMTITKITYHSGIRCDEDYDFGLQCFDDRKSIRLTCQKGNDRTCVEIRLLDFDYFAEEPAPNPSATQLREHNEFVNLVDCCIAFVVGVTLYDITTQKTVLFQVEDNYSKIFAEQQTDTDSRRILSQTIRIPIDYSIMGNDSDVRLLFNLVSQSQEDADLLTILQYWQKAVAEPRYAAIELFRAFERIQKKFTLELESCLTNSEVDFLGAYPQVQRHDSVESTHKNALALRQRFPEEFAKPSVGIAKYRALLRKCIYKIAFVES